LTYGVSIISIYIVFVLITMHMSAPGDGFCSLWICGSFFWCS